MSRSELYILEGETWVPWDGIPRDALGFTSSNTVIRAPFAFDDTSPLHIYQTPSFSVTVLTAQIQLNEAFDDGAATLTIGDAGDSDRLFTAADIDNITEAGVYTTTPNHTYASTTAVQLTITPGTSTQGSGFVLLEVQ